MIEREIGRRACMPEEPTQAMLERARRVAEATGHLLNYNVLHDIWQAMYDETASASAEANVYLEVCADIAVRWEGHQWRAYNIGKPAVNCSEHWSTGLGPLEVDEIFTLFSHSNVTFLPCK